MLGVLCQIVRAPPEWLVAGESLECVHHFRVFLLFKSANTSPAGAKEELGALMC